MDDLVKRLNNPPFGTETSERNLMRAAAARIAALEGRVAHMTAELEKANNEFGSQTATWPDLWKRIAQLKELSHERWHRAEKAEAKVAAADALADAAFSVWQALVGPPHFIREIQAIARLPDTPLPNLTVALAAYRGAGK